MTKFAPKHSYIDIKDFDSVKDAGKYLLKVSEDDKLFSSYFWYRQYYKPDPPQRKFVKSYCDLCSALHDGGEPGSVIEQFDDWWRGEAACHAAM